VESESESEEGMHLSVLCWVWVAGAEGVLSSEVKGDETVGMGVLSSEVKGDETVGAGVGTVCRAQLLVVSGVSREGRQDRLVFCRSRVVSLMVTMGLEVGFVPLYMYFQSGLLYA